MLYYSYLYLYHFHDEEFRDEILLLNFFESYTSTTSAAATINQIAFLCASSREIELLELGQQRLNVRDL